MKYMKAMIEAVELEAEAVVLTSGPHQDCDDDTPTICDYEI